MIAAYHGKTCCTAEILAVNPLRLRRKPLRGFGGMTARLGRASNAAMPFKAMSIVYRLR